MFLLFKLCLIILFQNICALKDTIRSKNLQLESLKQDLRRNNDDYADFRRSFSQTNNTQLDNSNSNDARYKIITTRDIKKVTKPNQNNNTFSNTNDKEDDRIKIIDNIRRRVNDALKSKEELNKPDDPQRRVETVNDQNKVSHNGNNNGSSIDRRLWNINQAKQRSLWGDMHNLIVKNSFKVNQHKIQIANKTNALPHLTTTIRTTKSTSKKKHVKKNKAEKFKKFVEKNKYLLRGFITSKKDGINVSPKLPPKQIFSQKMLKMLSGRQINNIMRQNSNASFDKKSLMELPNADVLDMYPAKGGRIHSKRVHGHLCHRHVLIPEGPKYNSQGQIYLPPHAAAIAHEYNSTDPPKLLLPKCCNCCHKSVLGCQ